MEKSLFNFFCFFVFVDINMFVKECINRKTAEKVIVAEPQEVHYLLSTHLKVWLLALHYFLDAD